VSINNNANKAAGFTLVELLITVAIVAVLATITLPSYLQFLKESRRADAHSALTALQLAQENLRGNCAYYAQNIAGANSCGADAANTDVKGLTESKDKYYDISIVANTATGNAYTIQADPKGEQLGDTDCDPIILTVNTLNPNGLKTPADCWE
jgi:type IV pilus assembly protein PilE